jgi:hypothetical protein
MYIRVIGILIFLTQIVGCTTLKMTVSENQSFSSLETNKSRVVFMRSSMHGTVIDAGIYEIVENSPKFIGILKNDTKMYIDTTPGEHVFMSSGSNVRFMVSDLEPRKTYYAIVAPRGWPGINFNLYPVRKDGNGEFNLNTDEFKGLLNDTVLVEIGPKAIEWSKDKTSQVNSQYEVEWPLWKSKPDSFKSPFIMHGSDGT